MMTKDEIRVSVDGPTLSLLLFEALNHGADAEGIILGREVHHVEDEQTDASEVVTKRTFKLDISSCVFTAVGPCELYDEFGEINLSTVDLLKCQRDPEQKLSVIGWFQFFTDVPVDSANSVSLTAKYVHRDLCKNFAKNHLLYLLISNQSASASSSGITEQGYQAFVSKPGQHDLKPVVVTIDNLGSTDHGNYTSEEVSPIDELHGGASGTPYIPNPHVAEVERLAQILERKITKCASSIVEMTSRQAATKVRSSGLTTGTLCKKDPAEVAQTRKQKEIDSLTPPERKTGGETEIRDGELEDGDLLMEFTECTTVVGDGHVSPASKLETKSPRTQLETDEECARRLQDEWNADDESLTNVGRELGTTTRYGRFTAPAFQDRGIFTTESDGDSEFPPLEAAKATNRNGRASRKKDTDPDFEPYSSRRASKEKDATQKQVADYMNLTNPPISSKPSTSRSTPPASSAWIAPDFKNDSSAAKSNTGTTAGGASHSASSGRRLNAVVPASGSSRSTRPGKCLLSEQVAESLFVDGDADSSQGFETAEIAGQEQARMAEPASRKFDQTVADNFKDIDSYSFTVADADGTEYETNDLCSGDRSSASPTPAGNGRTRLKRKTFSGGLKTGGSAGAQHSKSSADTNARGGLANGTTGSDVASPSASKPPLKKTKSGPRDEAKSKAKENSGVGRGRSKTGAK